MIHILDMLNYETPVLKEWKNGSLEIRKSSQHYELFIDGSKWNNYDTLFHSEVFQLFPHYYLAKGHCICTGMGFLIREKWILNNPNVTKVTVLENCKDLIDYHKEHNKDVMDRIDYIECDANSFIGECDTLLLDHYEQENDLTFLQSIKNVHKNIKAETTWAWSLETIIDETFDYSRPLESYLDFKKTHSMDFLPALNEQEILMFLGTFFMTDVFRKNSQNRFQYDYS